MCKKESVADKLNFKITWEVGRKKPEIKVQVTGRKKPEIKVQVTGRTSATVTIDIYSE